MCVIVAVCHVVIMVTIKVVVVGLIVGFVTRMRGVGKK